jgi:tetratricopeptide (TPR) repeat protein
MEIDSLNKIANVSLRYGDVETGLVTAREGLQLSRQVESSWGEVGALSQLALASLDIGEVEEAIGFAQRATEIAEVKGMSLMLPLTRTTLGVTYRQAGRFEDASAIFQRVLADNITDAVARCVKAELSAVYVLMEDWRRGIDYAKETLTGSLHPLLIVERQVWLEAEALARTGDLEAATQLVERFGERVGDSPRHRRAYERARARVRRHDE